MNAIDLQVPSNGIELAGTLVRPEGGFSPVVVVMIHGSGPVDRDENAKLQKLNVFNNLSDGLGRAGIANFRYDKRGNGKSGGKFKTAGISDFTADAEAVIAHLRQSKQVRFDHVVLLGHSEGTLIAADIAARGLADGLIQLAPFIEPMEKILRDQAQKGEDMIDALGGFQGKLVRFVTSIVGRPSQQQDKLIARVKSSDTDSIRMGLQSVPAKWLRELMAADMDGIYRQVQVPTLLVGGTKDLQCNPDDVAKIAQILGDLAEMHMIEDLTHILRRDAGAHDFNSYARLMKLPIDGEVVRLVVKWAAGFSPAAQSQNRISA